jgi:hypothetical protein
MPYSGGNYTTTLNLTQHGDIRALERFRLEHDEHIKNVPP